MSLTFKIEGLDRQLKRLGRIKGFRNIGMKEIAMKGRADVIDHFQRTSGPHSKWKPLKARKGKPLQDTGRLKGSLDARITQHTATVFTAVHYAGYHDAEDRGKAKFPRRQFMWISEKARASFSRTVAYYIGKSAK